MNKEPLDRLPNDNILLCISYGLEINEIETNYDELNLILREQGLFDEHDLMRTYNELVNDGLFKNRYGPIDFKLCDEVKDFAKYLYNKHDFEPLLEHIGQIYKIRTS